MRDHPPGTGILSRPAVQAGIVFVLALLQGTLLFRSFFRGASTWEFAAYAEIGRNILCGHGFTTRILYPGTLAILDRRGLGAAPYTPVIQRFPLPAFVSAASQALFGSTDFGSVAGTIAFFAAWVALVYAVGRKWFSSATAAVAAAFFAFDPSGLKYFVLGNFPDIHYGALLFAFHFLLASSESRLRAKRAAALGALGGGVWLARQNFWIGLPVYLAFILLRDVDRRRGLASCGIFLAAFGAVTFPFLASAARAGALVTPDGLWNLAYLVTTKGQPWMDFRVYSLAQVLARWPQVLWKGLSSAHTMLLDLPTIWQLQFVWPLLPLGAAALPAGAPRRFGWLNLCVFALQAPLFSMLRTESGNLGVSYRYFFWACPVLILIAVHGASVLLSRWSRRGRAAALAGWAVLNACLFLPFYTHGLVAYRSGHPGGDDPSAWPEIRYFRTHTPAGSSVITNIPWLMGWYASVSAIALPNDPAAVARIAAARPSSYLFLSFIRAGSLGDYPSWLALLRPRPAALADYCLKNGFRFVGIMPGVGALIELHPQAGSAQPSASTVPSS